MLDQVQIASPCHVSWDSMQGDERKRHCESCRLDVYNIAEMTRDEAEEFLRTSTGRVCARLYRRTDGTVLTRDCPKGIWLARKRLGKAAAFVLAMGFWMIAFALKPVERKEETGTPTERMKAQARTSPLIGPLIEKLDPEPPLVFSGQIDYPALHRPAPSLLLSPVSPKDSEKQ